jgi:peptidoglycan hydrolase-like protein with peptidoglycan-binding domain
MAARDRVTGPAQILRQILFHLGGGLITAQVSPPLSVPRTAATIIKQSAQTVALPPIQMRDPAPPATRLVENILEAQIALDRQSISPGSIDGEEGAQTEAALIAFQKKRGLAPGGLLDGQTKQLLLVTQPIFTNYTVTSADLAGLSPVSQTWLGKSEQPRRDFENILELLGEKAFSNPRLIRALNPNLNWNQIAGGTQVRILRVD